MAWVCECVTINSLTDWIRNRKQTTIYQKHMNNFNKRITTIQELTIFFLLFLLLHLLMVVDVRRFWFHAARIQQLFQLSDFCFIGFFDFFFRLSITFYSQRTVCMSKFGMLFGWVLFLRGRTTMDPCYFQSV